MSNIKVFHVVDAAASMSVDVDVVVVVVVVVVTPAECRLYWWYISSKFYSKECYSELVLSLY